MNRIENLLSTKNYLPEILIFCIALLSIFVTNIPILPFSILVVLFQLYRLDYNSNLFLLLTFLPYFVGCIFNSWGIRMIGGILQICGYFLLFYGHYNHRTDIYYAKKSILSTIVLLLTCFISMITTTGGDYAPVKMQATAFNGFINLAGFIVLFSNIKKCSPLLGVYYMLYAYLLMGIGVVVNDIQGASGLFDFGFFRLQSAMYYDPEDMGFKIDYQIIGYYFLTGLSIIMLQNKIRKIISRKMLLYFVVCGLLCVLYSGARQTIVVMAFLVALYFFSEYKSKSVIFLFVLYLVGSTLLQTSEGIFEIFGSTLEDGYIEGGGRGPWLLRGVELFLSNPVSGVGFGRYSFGGSYEHQFPHNMFVELLCELGIVGTLLILFFTISPILKNKQAYSFTTPMIIVFFLRSMASGGLDSNIIVYSIVFASPAILHTINIQSNKS